MALSTAADALQHVLALCPSGVRVCSWHHAARHVRSRRALSAWEPLIVYGGRELPTAAAQTVTDALVARGRHRAFPGALVGMKPPAFAVWLFEQLGACRGDELVDVFPGSGAITRAWRDYTGTAVASSAPASDPSLGPWSDVSWASPGDPSCEASPDPPLTWTVPAAADPSRHARIEPRP